MKFGSSPNRVLRRNRSQRLLSRIERAKKVTTRRIIDFAGFAPITEMKRSTTMGGSAARSSKSAALGAGD
jgi:hypothetical protein